MSVKFVPGERVVVVRRNRDKVTGTLGEGIVVKLVKDGRYQVEMLVPLGMRFRHIAAGNMKRIEPS